MTTRPPRTARCCARRLAALVAAPWMPAARHPGEAAIAPPATVEELRRISGPALDAVEPATEAPRDSDYALRGRRCPVPHQYGPRRSPSAGSDLMRLCAGWRQQPTRSPQRWPPHHMMPRRRTPAARFDSSHVAGGTAGAQPTGRPGQAQPHRAVVQAWPVPAAGFQGGQPSPYHAPNHPQAPPAPLSGGPLSGSAHPGPQGARHPASPQPTTMSKALGSGGVHGERPCTRPAVRVGAPSLTCLFVAWICAMSVQVGRKWLQFLPLPWRGSAARLTFPGDFAAGLPLTSRWGWPAGSAWR